MRNSLPAAIALVLFTSMSRVIGSELEFDHLWLVVSRDAPERSTLEHAGLTIAPGISRNDTGTASISAEFFNAYIELMWPDPTVPNSTWSRTRGGEV